MNKIKKYELLLKVLEYLSVQNNYVLRQNIISEPSSGLGNLEKHFNISLTKEEKNILALVLQDLQEKGLIEAVFEDIQNSGNDLMITSKGKVALQKKGLDKLDEMLLSLDSSGALVEKRYGAYEAALSKHTDWQRHIASSLVELIDQTLKTITPIVDASKIDKSKKGSIRKARISNFIMSKNNIRSESTEEVIDKAFELVESVRVRLEAIKHNEPQTEDEAELLIKLTEDAFCYLLKR